MGFSICGIILVLRKFQISEHFGLGIINLYSVNPKASINKFSL